MTATKNTRNRNAWTRGTGLVRLAFVLLQLALLPVAAWMDRGPSLADETPPNVEAGVTGAADSALNQEPVRLPTATA